LACSSAGLGFPVVGQAIARVILKIDHDGQLGAFTSIVVDVGAIVGQTMRWLDRCAEVTKVL
jgi:hypothetical protein